MNTHEALVLRRGRGALVLAVALSALAPSTADAQRRPHNQDRDPGPPVSAEEARERFKLPEGFKLELVAKEPDLVNPIKMAFDDRGRIWLVESLEYPRSSAGEGRDRIKILEDTDGDGVMDRFSIFAEGLNIPCGIALGYGGVFVTNSPDILFLKDTDGDGRADEREVILTGFGRYDTHELPNTLTWGPDGWLYGLNGVFNPARVTHKGKTYEFTCALFRYHPRTKDFELFSEGTSNPWGVGFDREGAAFVEACVIDHLFHLTETGYYHRQGGPYPPFTWKIESIVKHRNYKAAYCALDFYDADVYPPEYRNLVYYGNIHGNCINADSLTRDGSTYFGQRGPIILQTEDVWFMPVDIKLGPDGCFWVLDWYDRYHCYQDARRDPEGIDRLKGRLWRVAYGDVKQPRGYELGKESSVALVDRLDSPNRFWRDAARVILSERRDASVYPKLKATVLDTAASRVERMQSLWTLVGSENPGEAPVAIDEAFHLKLLALEDDGLRAWGVRAAGDLRLVGERVAGRVRELAADASPDVRLQVAIASRKLFGDEALGVLLEVLSRSAGDPLLPKIVWRNMEPLLETHGGELVAWLDGKDLAALPAVELVLGRMVERLLARREQDAKSLAGMVGLLLRNPDAHREPAVQCLEVLQRSLANRELDAETMAILRPRLASAIGEITKRGAGDPLYLPAVAIAASWGEPAALAACRTLLADAERPVEARGQALRALAARQDETIVDVAADLLSAPGGVPREFIVELLASLGRLESPRVAEVALARFATLPSTVQPQVIDLLCQRPAWALALLDRVAAGDIAASQLNRTQARRLVDLRDEEVTRRVTETWGTIREERDPAREQVIARMKERLATRAGDAWRGKAVFEKTCAQCHIIFGEGNTVGPDITVNGRETLDLLLSNLLDPNLVIGKDYNAYTVATRDGRVLTGLLAENSEQRVVLKVAGGTQEVVPRRDVVLLSESPISLMPEELETTITEDEFIDLIAFLRYDEAPPAPVETRVAAGVTGADRARIDVSQSYGVVTVSATFPGASGPVELATYEHSNDQRPFLHPLRAPGGGPILTALRPDDHPWQYGVFTGHARVDNLDFWHEKGWIRSRGLESVTQEKDRVELVSVAHWTTERRGGARVLVERQKLTVHAPAAADRYAIDVEWTLVADADLTIERYDYGGFAFRPAAHSDRRHAAPSAASRRPWQDVSGRFGEGDAARAAGVAIFDHPDNPRFPAGWRVDGEGLINPAITVVEPLELAAGEPVTYRYRLLVHDGHGDREMLDAEYRRWAPGAYETIEKLKSAGALRPVETDIPRPKELPRYQRELERWAPGFTLATVNHNEGGIRRLDEFRGRRNVMQSHPWSQEVPCWFEKVIEVPPKGARLRLGVGHHEQGDWRLEVHVDEETVVDTVVGPRTAKKGWRDIEVDLSKYAGRRVLLQLYNHANGWAWEFGYWSRIEVTGGE